MLVNENVRDGDVGPSCWMSIPSLDAAVMVEMPA